MSDVQFHLAKCLRQATQNAANAFIKFGKAVEKSQNQPKSQPWYRRFTKSKRGKK